MKGKRMLFGMMIVAALLIMGKPIESSAALYSGAWLPNDKADFFVAEFTFGANPGSFSMYDWGESDSLEIFSLGEPYGMKSVSFTQVGSTWFASIEGGTAPPLDLGDSLEFGFFFGDTTNEKYYSYNMETLILNEYYELSHESSSIIIGTSDIQPVPIPASALLLSSGIVGLIAFGRVRRRSSP